MYLGLFISSLLLIIRIISIDDEDINRRRIQCSIQQWASVLQVDTEYYIVGGLNGQCAVRNGGDVDLTEDGCGLGSKWIFKTTAFADTYSIHSADDEQIVWSVLVGGVMIEAGTFTGADEQLFEVVQLSNGFYEITDKKYGKNAHGEYAGVNIQSEDKTSVPAQTWHLLLPSDVGVCPKTETAYLLINDPNSLCMKYESNDFAYIKTCDPTSTPFRFSPNGPYYWIEDAADDTRALTIQLDSAAEFMQLTINWLSAAVFSCIPVTSTTFMLVSKTSGMALDGQNGEGQPAIQRKSNLNTPTQMWRAQYAGPPTTETPTTTVPPTGPRTPLKSQKALIYREMDAPGGTLINGTSTTPNIIECALTCSATHQCIAGVYENATNQCGILSRVGNKEPLEGKDVFELEF